MLAEGGGELDMNLIKAESFPEEWKDSSIIISSWSKASPEHCGDSEERDGKQQQSCLKQ